MKIQGRLFNVGLPRGYQWQEFEIELPEDEVLEKLHALLLEVASELELRHGANYERRGKN